jgi:hypothetical protein
MSVRAHPIKCRLFRKDKRRPYTELEYLFIDTVFIGFIVNDSRRDYRISCRINKTIFVRSIKTSRRKGANQNRLDIHRSGIGIIGSPRLAWIPIARLRKDWITVSRISISWVAVSGISVSVATAALASDIDGGPGL